MVLSEGGRRHVSREASQGGAAGLEEDLTGDKQQERDTAAQLDQQSSAPAAAGPSTRPRPIPPDTAAADAAASESVRIAPPAALQDSSLWPSPLAVSSAGPAPRGVFGLGLLLRDEPPQDGSTHTQWHHPQQQQQPPSGDAGGLTQPELQPQPPQQPAVPPRSAARPPRVLRLSLDDSALLAAGPFASDDGSGRADAFVHSDGNHAMEDDTPDAPPRSARGAAAAAPGTAGWGSPVAASGGWGHAASGASSVRDQDLRRTAILNRTLLPSSAGGSAAAAACGLLPQPLFSSPSSPGGGGGAAAAAGQWDARIGGRGGAVSAPTSPLPAPPPGASVAPWHMPLRGPSPRGSPLQPGARSPGSADTALGPHGASPLSPQRDTRTSPHHAGIGGAALLPHPPLAGAAARAARRAGSPWSPVLANAAAAAAANPAAGDLPPASEIAGAPPPLPWGSPATPRGGGVSVVVAPPSAARVLMPDLVAAFGPQHPGEAEGPLPVYEVWSPVSSGSWGAGHPASCHSSGGGTPVQFQQAAAVHGQQQQQQGVQRTAANAAQASEGTASPQAVLLGDESFVAGLLAGLPGVDAASPPVAAALAALRGGPVGTAAAATRAEQPTQQPLAPPTQGP